MADDELIYLDNNATTQLDPAVIEEMLPFFGKYYGNPSAGYAFAAQARKAVDLARDRLARLLGCEPSEIVFTSGGTESNNAVINSALQFEPRGKFATGRIRCGGHVVTSAVEHSAVLRPCQDLTKRGCDATFLGVDRHGNIDLGELEAAIRPETTLVSMMWANNETGVLFPVEKIAEMCREKGVLFHTDAVQAAGKIPIRLRDTAINFLSLSAHKFHGPKGVGALYVNRRTRFHPLIAGGGQEDGRRGGTENVAAIAGLGKAAERAGEFLSEGKAHVGSMRDRFEEAILRIVSGASVNGAGAARVPNTSSCSFEGIESPAALLLLDRHRICCSAGSACRTGSQEASHVLRAMNPSGDGARRSLRFSFGRFNTEAQVDRAIEVVPKVIEKLRQMATPVRASVASTVATALPVAPKLSEGG
ncbi:MAG TPA: aminotransferase class V-fold PLP-dependent enzyme [Candidatus Udaeobacter sp.]|jgi:cysteine desulfurase|nr:aminotransferase class V-fold PLP-dependent enzyme [Candidatus Udaeobacter sp.]